MLRTVQQVASGFNRRAIDAVAHTNLALGTAPSPSGWREPAQQNPGRVFLSVEATHISVVYLRETFELLAKTDPRLPATFYRMLCQAVSQWILCYDESAAQSYYEYRMEDYEDAKASGEAEEGLEKPQTVEEAKGPWLERRFKPWPVQHFPAVISSIRKGSKARTILEATVSVWALSRKRKNLRPDWKDWEQSFPNGSYTIPFTILAFHEQDIVCQAFESDEQDWLNGGEDPIPAFLRIIDPSSLDSIRSAFEDLRHFLSMTEAFGELLALLPGADLLEVEN